MSISCVTRASSVNAAWLSCENAVTGSRATRTRAPSVTWAGRNNTSQVEYVWIVVSGAPNFNIVSFRVLKDISGFPDYYDKALYNKR